MTKVLLSNISKYNNRTLLIGENSSISYKEIICLSQQTEFVRTSRALVMSLLDNSIESLSGYFALLIADSVQLLQSIDISKSVLDHLIDKYSPKYIWLPLSRISGIEAGEIVFSNQKFCLVKLRDSAYFLDASNLLLLPTSGSTGSPKLVRLSHTNVITNANSIAEYLSLTSKEIPITTLQPSYSYGLSILHSHFLVGASIAVTTKTFFDRDFWRFLQEVKATSFGGVPYHYEILKKIRFLMMDHPYLKTLTQAGGRMEPSLIEEFAQHCQLNGMRFFTMYGQTEATARISYLPSEKSILKLGSIGNSIPGGKLWLEDESGQVINQSGLAGELVYEGLNVSLGYANGYQDLALGDERGGVLRTGDIAKRDQDGDYYIVGRKARFLKLFGHRINLSDVEKCLTDLGYTVGCSGEDDRIEIYSVNIDAEKAVQIKKSISKLLKIPNFSVLVYLIDELPRNEFGKIQYTKLKSNIGKFLV